ILLFRVEERVTRRPAGGVEMAPCYRRPAVHPTLHALERRSIIRATPPRLEMIGQRDPDALDRDATLRQCAKPRATVSRQPQVQRPARVKRARTHRVPSACGEARRAVGVQAFDCVPRTKAMNPSASARFMERK